MRKAPPYQRPLVAGPPRRLAIEVELLTPQLGGGYAAMQVDPTAWLRSASVRGALRFWWRATAGASSASVSTMRQREAEIFGMTKSKLKSGQTGSMAGKLRISVSCKSQVSADRSPPTRPSDALMTAYFAAGMQDQPVMLLDPSGNVRPRAEIVLTTERSRDLSDAQWKEIRLALQCFVVFGGAGSRTRRAAGSLGVLSEDTARHAGIPCTRAETCEWLKGLDSLQINAGLPQFIVAQAERYLVTDSISRAESIHKQLLGIWKDYRQMKEPGSTRSAWPEAPAIVRMRQPGGGHSGTAPRAHFGLPLNLQNLKGCRPDKAELVGFLASKQTGKDGARALKRYASPVWLAVHRVFQGGQTEYMGIIVVTPSTLPATMLVGTEDRQTERLQLPDWEKVSTDLCRYLIKVVGLTVVQA